MTLFCRHHRPLSKNCKPPVKALRLPVLGSHLQHLFPQSLRHFVRVVAPALGRCGSSFLQRMVITMVRRSQPIRQQRGHPAVFHNLNL